MQVGSNCFPQRISSHPPVIIENYNISVTHHNGQQADLSRGNARLPVPVGDLPHAGTCPAHPKHWRERGVGLRATIQTAPGQRWPWNKHLILTSILKNSELAPPNWSGGCSSFTPLGWALSSCLKSLLPAVCLYTYGHPPEICANLTSSPDIQTQVQLRVNYINLLNLVFKAIPIFILSFYVGTLADRMGMKPFILMSLIGKLLSMMQWNFETVVQWPV